MAKTRIKTTPTRMQKEALMASAAVTTTTNIVTEHVFKKRLSVLKKSITAKESIMPIQSTIIVQPTPKRTNSISSTTSTISHTSDGSHCHAESPPPNLSITPTQNNGPTMAELTENAIKTLNAGLLAKSNALALKNRKVYMITEKCDDPANGNSNNKFGSAGSNGHTTGQKRKMYLIMEEKESVRNETEHKEKLIRTENTNKKLTLFTDTANGQLPQKIEKILPEILNCIQAKNGTATSNSNTNSIINPKTELIITEQTTPQLVKEINNKSLLIKHENNERLPLTLPPKKNRTKIITTQIIPVNPQTNAIYQQQQQQQNIANDNWTSVQTVAASAYIPTGNINGFCKTEKSIGATPVIVNASTLMNTTNGHNTLTNGNKIKEIANGNNSSYCSSSSSSNQSTANQLHKNINLSTDFLFLMKMLPKLESIEEPHKNYVKTCIEDIINQYCINHNEEQ
ncbi:bip1 isoform 1-T3 [Cochliomyia hominivorax]